MQGEMVQPKLEEEQPKQGRLAQKQTDEEEEIQAKRGNENKGQQNAPTGSRTQIPVDEQAKMENSFGTSFSNVNIHQNDTSATQMGALAYTQGSDVHFASGQYNPGSQKGQELLGHELTHVVQQRQGRVQPTKQGKGMAVNDSPALENEADLMGAKATQGYDASAVSGKGSGIQKQTPEEKMREFQSQTYSQENFKPSTGRGVFDVSLNPVNGRLEVKVYVNMNFKDGDPSRFSNLKGQSEVWTDAEKTKWTKDFIMLIEGRWVGKYHFVNPDLPGILVYTDVEVEESQTDWHYRLDVTKIPTGEWEGSSITHYLNSSGNSLAEKNNHFGTLDSEDLSWSDKGVSEKQKEALHEFGHMIGLGDEYADSRPGITHAALVQNALGETLIEGKTNDIMSSGNSIVKQHYVTFLGALQTITSDNRWQFKP